MHSRNISGAILAGFLAGTVTGLLGAGGGMVLVPMLTVLTKLDDDRIFPCSIAIILPICLTSLTVTALNGTVELETAIPYLIGSALGGLTAGKWGQKIPVKWLHRGLGIMILWGGFRYLC